MIVTLRRRYREGLRYKSQKSTNGNSGNKNKKRVNKAPNQRQLAGQKVQLLNMSNEDQFCASSGVQLPKRGMVVKHNGEYYRDYREAELAG